MRETIRSKIIRMAKSYARSTYIFIQSVPGIALSINGKFFDEIIIECNIEH